MRPREAKPFTKLRSRGLEAAKAAWSEAIYHVKAKAFAHVIGSGLPQQLFGEVRVLFTLQNASLTR